MQRQEKTNVLSMNSPITATHCNTPQHTATHCKDRKRPTFCRWIRRETNTAITATHCYTLQHTALMSDVFLGHQLTATHCKALQHTPLHTPLISEVFLGHHRNIYSHFQLCSIRTTNMREACCSVLQCVAVIAAFHSQRIHPHNTPILSAVWERHEI